MDESVIERGEDVGNTEDKFALSDLRAELNGSLFFLNFAFLGWLEDDEIVLKSVLFPDFKARGCDHPKTMDPIHPSTYGFRGKIVV